MSNVLIEKDKLDVLATAIANKSGEPLKLTLSEMVEAVDGIETGGGGVTVTDEPNANGITCVITSGTGPTPPIPDIPLNTQLVDYTSLSPNSGLNGQGEVIQIEWYYLTDYTPVASGMTFDYRAGYWMYIGVYDSEKNVVNVITVQNDATISQEDQNVGVGSLSGIELPANAAYVRMCSSGASSTYLSLIRIS